MATFRSRAFAAGSLGALLATIGLGTVGLSPVQAAPTADPSSAAPATPQAHVEPVGDFEPDFGTGKDYQYVSVQPLPGSAYVGTVGAAENPLDMSGAHVRVYDNADPSETIGECVTDENGICGYTVPIGTYISGHTYTATTVLDDPATGKGLPRGFLAPQAVPFDPTATADCQIGCYYETVRLEAPGAWRQIQVQTNSSVDAKPLSPASYLLCSPVVPPVTAAPGACPTGSTQLATATSDATGLLTFPGIYRPTNAPGADPENPAVRYSIVETATQAGYKLPTVPTIVIDVPGVPGTGDGSLASANDIVPGTGEVDETSAEALSQATPAQIAAAKSKLKTLVIAQPGPIPTIAPVLVKVLNDSDVPAPVAVADAVSTPAGSSVTISVVGNDNGYGAPITLTSVGAPSNGTAVITADGKVLYTPAAGFTGTDSFTYVITTRGGSATGVVTVTVVGLASTGSPAEVELVWGLSVLAAGGLLVAASRRRTV